VLDHLFSCLTAWLAPICCFTAEEAWWARGGGAEESVHLRLFPSLPAGWRDEALGRRWNRLRDLRRVVTGAIELERAAKRIGSSLQAHPTVYAPAVYAEALAGLDLAELSITSSASLRVEPPPEGAFTLPDVADLGVVVGLAEGEKCERCWRVLPEVALPKADHLCARCAEAVR
jgi:isoleucyl-tRNA synthetase